MADEYILRKRRDLARLAGKPRNVLPHEFAEALEKLRRMHDDGMAYSMLAAQTGLEKSTIQKILTAGQRSMRRESYDAIMALRYVPPQKGAHRRFGARVDLEPTWRRLAALNAAGYPSKWLGEFMGYDRRNLRKVLRRKSAFVFAVTADEVRSVYAKLINSDPADWGITELQSRLTREHAQKAGYPPAVCWDDDTIDDPDAFPEWTGECGTVSGYYLHLKYGILVHETKGGNKAHKSVLCEPCKAARAEAKRTRYGKVVDVDGIWEEIQSGKPYRRIAEEYKCSTRTVQRIKREKSKEGDNSGAGAPAQEEAVQCR